MRYNVAVLLLSYVYMCMCGGLLYSTVPLRIVAELVLVVAARQPQQVILHKNHNRAGQMFLFLSYQVLSGRKKL